MLLVVGFAEDILEQHPPKLAHNVVDIIVGDLRLVTEVLYKKVQSERQLQWSDAERVVEIRTHHRRRRAFH